MKSKSITILLASALTWLALSTAQAVSPAAASVQALFGLSTPQSGPFPSDHFTVPDPTQNTRLKIELPKPDCATRPSDCEDLDVINSLDGFNLQPRLSIPFGGSIDPATVTSHSVFLVSLGSTLPGGDSNGHVIGINQIVWDPATTSLYAESDELLDQHTRYVLVVTKGVLDQQGKHVKATTEFLEFIDPSNSASTGDAALDAYRTGLRNALTQIDAAGVVAQGQVVAASLFTTQSITAFLEKVRDQIKASTPEPATFLLGLGGTRTVFALSEVTLIQLRRQKRPDPSFDDSFETVTVIKSPFPNFLTVPGSVGAIAFGKYTSPDYMVHPGEFIPPFGTLSGIPAKQGQNEVFFNLILPSGPKPARGWPVAIYGYGDLNDKNNGPLPVASKIAASGIATIAINTPGHGFGPLGTLIVTLTTGALVPPFPSVGRGIDQNGDGLIGNSEGSGAAPPRDILGRRDGNRQTVVDHMQLVRLIELGKLDADGDGEEIPDLDPSRIYYFGQSRGGIHGVLFLAIEPSVRVGVANAFGTDETFHLSTENRSGFGAALQSRVPSLINAPGVTSLDGITVEPPYFNENMPLRDGVQLTTSLSDGTTAVVQSPVTNTVAGAIEIQDLIDRNEWAAESGDPAAYARHLRLRPLDGVPPKSVILQMAKGDQVVANPTSTVVIRAGDLADRTTFYRNDLAFSLNPKLADWPHLFLITVQVNLIGVREVALGAQQQIASFFASNGSLVIDPDPIKVINDCNLATPPTEVFAFEVPIIPPLPEGLNYLPSCP